MLQSVMFSDFNAYDFGFFSRREMNRALRDLSGKVSFARLAAWGRGLLDRDAAGPATAHLLRDVVADA